MGDPVAPCSGGVYIFDLENGGKEFLLAFGRGKNELNTKESFGEAQKLNQV